MDGHSFVDIRRGSSRWAEGPDTLSLIFVEVPLGGRAMWTLFRPVSQKSLLGGLYGHSFVEHL